MSKKYTLLTFQGNCMNFLLELKFFILSHPVTSKQPPKIVQIHMRHPVDWSENGVKKYTNHRLKWSMYGSIVRNKSLLP